MIRRIVRPMGSLLAVATLRWPIWAQEAIEETGAKASSEVGGLTPWSALVVLGTLVIVLGGILLYLAIERRRT